MATCIICLVLAVVFLVLMFVKLGKGEDIRGYTLGLFLFIILSFTLPSLIGLGQTNKTEITLQEYEVCEYQSESYYIVDDKPYKFSGVSIKKVSRDNEAHVALIKRLAPKSIWYFYSSGEYLTAYIPMECK